MKHSFKLGDKVIIHATLEKRQVYEEGKGMKTFFSIEPIENTLGIYIGYRTVQVGTTRYGEDGPEFRPTGLQFYFLVVTNERRSPVKVPVNFIL